MHFLNYFMKKNLLLFFVSFVNLIFAQNSIVHFGYGLEHDSYFADLNHKIDLAYESKLNRHFAFGAALSMSLGNLSTDIHWKYHHLLPREYSRVTQMYALIFWSPWRNDRRNNFKIGLGVTAVHVHTKYLEFAKIENNTLVNHRYKIFNEPGVYPIIAVENDFRINRRFTIGIKLQANFKGIETTPKLPQTFDFNANSESYQYRGSYFISAAMIRLGYFL